MNLAFARRALRAVGTAALLLHLAAAEATSGLTDPAPAMEMARDGIAARLERWRAGDAQGVQVLDPLVAERIRLLRHEAPSFDHAWLDLESGSVPVVIGTREQLALSLPRYVRASRDWAGITVTWDGETGQGTERAAVALRVEWLRELHASYGNSEASFLEALDGLLIHEIYGHLAPAVQARAAATLCGDPEPGQSLATSCVGRREIALKAERRAVRTAGRGEIAATAPETR